MVPVLNVHCKCFFPLQRTVNPKNVYVLKKTSSEAENSYKSTDLFREKRKHLPKITVKQPNRLESRLSDSIKA